MVSEIRGKIYQKKNVAVRDDRTNKHISKCKLATLEITANDNFILDNI